MSENLYRKICIDPSKCKEYLEFQEEQATVKRVEVVLQKTQELQSCTLEEYVQQVLEFLDGQRKKFEFNKRNQFDFVMLCDIF